MSLFRNSFKMQQAISYVGPLIVPWKQKLQNADNITHLIPTFKSLHLHSAQLGIFLVRIMWSLNYSQTFFDILTEITDFSLSEQDKIDTFESRSFLKNSKNTKIFYPTVRIELVKHGYTLIWHAMPAECGIHQAHMRQVSIAKARIEQSYISQVL